ncbi:hypothetical protein GUJ93_ZPchr0003g17171 [Zizania palustris]|uniref:Uncharacterized protein n=1 Tax=Zizania palustris TaxID=103762 RepID=A0A8J5VXA6_ZIZPA|nr:hypothetical protein GUJ93_ZPchr0003g17171 [Zizania palustris]
MMQPQPPAHLPSPATSPLAVAGAHAAAVANPLAVAAAPPACPSSNLHSHANAGHATARRRQLAPIVAKWWRLPACPPGRAAMATNAASNTAARLCHSTLQLFGKKRKPKKSNWIFFGSVLLPYSFLS